MTPQSDLKRLAAHRAVDFVTSGMVLGLGTGSTTRFAIEKIGEKVRSGALTDVVGIPSSEASAQLAREAGIPLSDFSRHPRIDLTIDGADEVDPRLHLIKGGGGALLREKVLAQNSRQNVIVVDESKLVQQLGQTWPVPVEVIPFAWPVAQRVLTALGASVTLRQNGDRGPFQTDQQNYILDARFGPIEDPYALASQMKQVAGIVEHGLFLNLATRVVVAGGDGVRIISGQNGDALPRS